MVVDFKDRALKRIDIAVDGLTLPTLLLTPKTIKGNIQDKIQVVGESFCRHIYIFSANITFTIHTSDECTHPSRGGGQESTFPRGNVIFHQVTLGAKRLCVCMFKE